MAFEFLLGAQLQTEIRQFATATLPMLAGAIIAAINRALRASPDVFPDPAINLIFRRYALAHAARSSNLFANKKARTCLADWRVI
jgi:hypothetical protein